MFMIILYMFAFFFAYRAYKIETGKIQILDYHEKVVVIGLSYAQAMLCLVLPIYTISPMVDNFIIYMPTFIFAVTLLVACFFDFNKKPEISNKYLKNGYFALLISIMIVFLFIPATDYKIPQPNSVETQQLQEHK